MHDLPRWLRLDCRRHVVKFYYCRRRRQDRFWVRYTSATVRRCDTCYVAGRRRADRMRCATGRHSPSRQWGWAGRLAGADRPMALW